jgi:hypothetical protein
MVEVLFGARYKGYAYAGKGLSLYIPPRRMVDELFAEISCRSSNTAIKLTNYHTHMYNFGFET